MEFILIFDKDGKWELRCSICGANYKDQIQILFFIMDKLKNNFLSKNKNKNITGVKHNVNSKKTAGKNQNE